MSNSTEKVNPGSGRISDIEILRAIAVIFTIYNHLGHLLDSFDRSNIIYSMYFASFTFSTYWGGVDLFFCISGFVIALHFSENFLQGSKSGSFWAYAKAFWIRRIFRIWPLAYFWLAMTIFFSIFLNASGAFGNLRLNIYDSLAAILQVANFHYMACHNLFFDPGCGPINISYWSLSLEEQFYLAFPFLLLLGKSRAVSILAIAAASQFFISRWPAEPLWWVRTDALMFGVLLALLFKLPSYRRFEPTFLEQQPSSARVKLLLLLVVCLAIVPAEHTKLFSFATGLLALVSALLVYFASFNKNYLMSPGKYKTVLVYLGSRSYSLYLVHMPAIGLTKELFWRLNMNGIILPGNLALYHIAVMLALLLPLSELGYNFIEKPLRAYGVKIAKKTGMVETKAHQLDAAT